MHYVSTKGDAEAVCLADALLKGLAPDGGLFTPETLPRADEDIFRTLAHEPFAGAAARLLRPFFAGDVLEADLENICQAAFTFDAVARPTPNNGPWFLELYHGPTAAFKDFGAQFLAQCLSRLSQSSDKPLLIVTATSGDTGAAAAAAFDRAPGVKSVVLYPKGRVSPLQERQLGCWSDNVLALRVSGDFDACQKITKNLFASGRLEQAFRPTSANSINIGRILAQIVYFARGAAAILERTRMAPMVVVPTGNLGNALACVWAREMGAPIGAVVMATNANTTIPEFFIGNPYNPRASIKTLATAMDVGAPSNFERLRFLYPDLPTDPHDLAAYMCSDEDIRRSIKAAFERFGVVICPHTATGFHAYDRLSPGDNGPWMIAATAHAFKFEESVGPILGAKLTSPPALSDFLDRSSSAQDVAAREEHVAQAIEAAFGN